MSNPLPTPEEIRNLPPNGGPGFNRLIHETSPYLLQHARNPVDWYPWGREAFDRAVREDKPIFLSIGYSTCHWCHVMERESFESERIAEILNEHYVAIKVDREERPDLDETYMNATYLLTGRGGWPNSVWLKPDGTPWYAGTYFPPEDRQGMPGFRSVLLQLAQIWRTRRADVDKQAQQLAGAIRGMSEVPVSTVEPSLSRDLVNASLTEMRESFDARFGGFGDAPKFPPHAGLELLFQSYRRTRDDSLLAMATSTLNGMALGGIHDQVGGGFHRYAIDSRWFLPHFEKMLYDNALLARSYAEGHLLTRDAAFRRVVIGICEWVLRDMTDPEGGFYSGLDADSEGVEGKFYVWTRREILDILAPEEGESFCRAYGVAEDGNYGEEFTGRHNGNNILHLREWPEGGRFDECRRRLLEHRNARIWPHRDDKVLSGWNGLMIGSPAYVSQHLDFPDYRLAAEKAARFILDHMRRDGRLLRSWRQGRAQGQAYLEDYAFLADGLLDLHAATGDSFWLTEATILMDTLHEHFEDRQHGGYFQTADDHEPLLSRPRPAYDQAVPSGNGIAARTLVRLFQTTHQRRWFDRARRTLKAFVPVMQRVPLSTESLIHGVEVFLNAREAAGQSAFELLNDVVRVQTAPDRLRGAPGETVGVEMRLEVAKGYHINSNLPLQEHLMPTTIRLDDAPGISLGEITYPPGTRADAALGPEPLSIYEGTVFVTIPLKIAANAHPGSMLARLSVQLQACTIGECMAPQTLSIPVEIEVTASQPPSGTGPG